MDLPPVRLRFFGHARINRVPHSQKGGDAALAGPGDQAPVLQTQHPLAETRDSARGLHVG